MYSTKQHEEANCLPGSNILWITEERAAELATVNQAYDSIKEALKLHAAGDFDQPLKPYVRPGGRAEEFECGRLITMPAWLGGDFRVLGAKLITGFPANIGRGLPRASGLIALFDPGTGAPIALMECRAISARRTAAVASIAVDTLAVTEPLRIAVLGAGPIAHETIKSLLSRPRKIDVITLYDPHAERAAGIVRCVSPRTETPVVVAQSARECVSAANVVITATTGAKGYIQLEWLNGPWLAIALSLDDFDSEVVLSADKVVCDDFDQCNREEKLFHKLINSGALRREDVYAELGEIVAGIKRGREGQERIFVNPMGMGIEDLALAHRVYQQAVRAGEDS